MPVKTSSAFAPDGKRPDRSREAKSVQTTDGAARDALREARWREVCSTLLSDQKFAPRESRRRPTIASVVVPSRASAEDEMSPRCPRAERRPTTPPPLAFRPNDSCRLEGFEFGCQSGVLLQGHRRV